MKYFNDKISLVKNSRGCYILDTVKGCSGVNESRPRGCYGDCYAHNIASRYALDFTHPVKRDFSVNKLQPMLFDFADESHMSEIIRQIKAIDMPFVRIGEMGDPSEDWAHTLKICAAISYAIKPIVIITKHWNRIPDNMLGSLRLLNLYINTSVSALDTDDEITARIGEYNRLRPYCNSILRVVTCNFNTDSKEGFERNEIQNYLLWHNGVIETVFRPSASNKLITDGVIKVSKKRFLRSTVLASARVDDIYMGPCGTCHDMCGVR